MVMCQYGHKREPKLHKAAESLLSSATAADKSLHLPGLCEINLLRGVTKVLYYKNIKDLIGLLQREQVAFSNPILVSILFYWLDKTLIDLYI